MSLFYSYVVRDVVEVEPVYFAEQTAVVEPVRGAEEDGEDGRRRYHSTLDDILTHRLTERYVGRVAPGLGLCVAVHDITHYTQGVVRGPSASAWLTVQFRLCVFAPTPGARLRARIGAQTREGIYLTLDFFEFLFFVPGDLLVSPSFYHEEKKCWMLRIDGDEESDASEQALNAYGNGDEVIVKVEQVIVRDPVEFHDNFGMKNGGGTSGSGDGGGSGGGDNSAAGGAGEMSAATKLPMEIRGSFLGTGLGPVLWF